jgi:hypothetical protein
MNATRGRRLEEILHEMLDDAGLSPRLAYRPKGEEIDGSFVIAEQTLLLEAKWTQEPQSASALYSPGSSAANSLGPSGFSSA